MLFCRFPGERMRKVPKSVGETVGGILYDLLHVPAEIQERIEAMLEHIIEPCFECL